MLRNFLKRTFQYLLPAFAIVHATAAIADHNNGASELGAGYAFLTLMALSPDFSAANYEIENDDGTQVDINITRFPFSKTIMKNKRSSLDLEFAVAHQSTRETFQIFPAPDEYIDTKWISNGASLGLLYEKDITKHLQFTPSLRVGASTLQNNADYYGELTNAISEVADGSLLNWDTNTALVSIGSGFRYHWRLLDRESRINTNVYRIRVNSFDESNDLLHFDEVANMLSINGDMIFPTNVHLFDERLDMVLLVGSTTFFGENRETLGYTSSYQAGFGSELPVRWNKKIAGHVRFSGQFLWAQDMSGWKVSLGFKPRRSK